jgi:hypothetical protein
VPKQTTVDLAQELMEYVQDGNLRNAHGKKISNWTPFLTLADIAANIDVDPSVRVRAASELAGFYLPKLRGVESVHNEQTNYIFEASKDGR